MNLLYTIMHNN